MAKNVHTYKKIFKFFLRLQHNTKLYHWNTLNYATHLATDEFAKKLSTSIDKFIEIYITYYKRPFESLKNGLNIKFKILNKMTFPIYLDKCFAYLKSMDKTTLAQHIDLMNVRDDILTSISQTKYLLSFCI